MLRKVLWTGLYGALGAARGVGDLAGRDGREAAREAMNAGDRAVEAGAEKLEALSVKAATKGGLIGKLSGELADDAAFVRKLKPSLIVARARGEAPKDAEPGKTAVRAPSRPQLGPRATPKDGPNPFAVAGAAFAVGTLLAKMIDWRGHAHPRR